MRRTASSTFPFSFLHGMTTDTASSSGKTGGGSIRATTTCVMHSLFRNGRRAQKRLKKPDSNGRYFGKSTIRCVSRASTGELQQVSDIGRGKPVLRGSRHLHPNPFGE